MSSPSPDQNLTNSNNPISDNTCLSDKKSLRQQLRLKRRQLNSWQQRKAAYGLAKQLKQRRFKKLKKIAIYLANDGEISPALLSKNQRLSLYLPVINGQSLVFVHYKKGQSFKLNRFGIKEPARIKQRYSAQQLHAIALPLVGFDARGGRLGMGGGFYDRALAKLKSQNKYTSAQQQTQLIGLAHSLQQLPQCPLEPWDIPLDFVVTEQRVFSCA